MGLTPFQAFNKLFRNITENGSDPTGNKLLRIDPRKATLINKKYIDIVKPRVCKGNTQNENMVPNPPSHDVLDSGRQIRIQLENEYCLGTQSNGGLANTNLNIIIMFRLRFSKRKLPIF